MIREHRNMIFRVLAPLPIALVCGLIVIIYWSHVYYTSLQALYLGPTMALIESANLVIFNIIVAMLLWAYARVILTHAGRVPQEMKRLFPI